MFLDWLVGALITKMFAHCAWFLVISTCQGGSKTYLLAVTVLSKA
jgi:hypothetical protein